MSSLRTENTSRILEIIGEYCETKRLDLDDTIDEMCGVIEEQVDDSENLDVILDLWVEESRQSVYYAEEELYTVMSIYIEKLLRDDLLEQIEKDDLDDIMFFLDENYKKIFSDYYEKRKRVDEKDFDDCVLSVSKSYGMSEDVAEVFVSMYVEKNILNISI